MYIAQRNRDWSKRKVAPFEAPGLSETIVLCPLSDYKEIRCTVYDWSFIVSSTSDASKASRKPGMNARSRR